ncbi:Abi family protein [Ruegeria spongiae]|uniref:Abi family protein n=1 Tax=Ruegeria spongiae TaxID=2942209 RepID=UPI0035712F6A
MAFPSVASAQGLAFFMYNKPYLPVAQQIELLLSRGMVIDDLPKASEYLQRIGYYRLSAYWHPMRQRDADSGTALDNFVPGTTFKEATDLYTFDGRLRLIMLDALERLEVSLRTEIALCLGRYHPNAHRALNCLGRDFAQPTYKGGPTKHREWLQRLDKRANESKDQFAQHFRTKYPSEDMPIWIAVELLDFGPLSHLISGMRNNDLAKIGASFGGLRPRFVKSWARSLAFTRNLCAHHSRLWNKPLVNQPALVGQDVPEGLQHIQALPDVGKRLYSIASVARFMLQTANPRTAWKERFVTHIDSFPTSPRLSLSSAGFPEDWRSHDIWK